MTTEQVQEELSHLTLSLSLSLTNYFQTCAVEVGRSIEKKRKIEHNYIGVS